MYTPSRRRSIIHRRRCSSNDRLHSRRRTHTYTRARRVVAAMLDFGCGAGSHSHFQFVTVSQTASGRRLARTPLAGRPARSRRVFNKLLVIYISTAVIRTPPHPREPFTFHHSPLRQRDERRGSVEPPSPPHVYQLYTR